MRTQLTWNSESPSPVQGRLSLRGAVTRRLAGVIVAGLVLSACGGETTTGSSSSGDAAEDGVDMALFGMSEEEFRVRTEQEVQRCMTAKGWEYELADVDGPAAAGPGSDGDPAEYARQSGYGISGVAVVGPAAEDPNAAYLESLSPAEFDAYTNDLYGPPSDDQMLTTGGCYGEAEEAAAGPGGMDAMVARFEQLNELITADSGIIEATKQWSACMAEAGYAYNTPDEPIGDFFERVAGIESDDTAAHEALRQEEIATAVADEACKASSGLVTAQEEALQRAAEQLGSN